MMFSRATLTLIVGTLALANADNFAVIVAGSSTYANYRHQADACHAYKIAIKNGIPEKNVILFLVDDVANSHENPFKGKLFNKPTANGVPGVDVYEGCKPSYTGKQVNSKNFEAVLTGDSATATGPVLQSTSKDKVFINFVDHGGVGLIAFPEKVYHKKQLMTTLQTMHSKKMYSRLVFYLEACESGSMFEGKDGKTHSSYLKSMNIFATTAANGKESSWGTYCPPQDKVNGKHIGSCLGDLYSVNWMEDSDKAAEQASESLKSQWLLVKKETNKSHVLKFGDNTILQEHIHDYQGEAAQVRPVAQPGAYNTSAEEVQQHSQLKMDSSVDSRDIGLVTKFYAYLRADAGERAEQAKALVSEVQHREDSHVIFQKLVAAVTGDTSGALLSASMPVEQHTCHMEATAGVQAACGRFTDYSLK